MNRSLLNKELEKSALGRNVVCAKAQRELL